MQFLFVKGDYIIILVDADACPVKDIIINIAKERNIEVILFSDTAHELYDDYCKIVTVSKGQDSVDMTIINTSLIDDIVVTQDFGLASLILGKKIKALNQNGLIYTNDNIEKLLFERFLGQKIRRSGGRTTNQKKRSKLNDLNFEKSLLKLINNI